MSHLTRAIPVRKWFLRVEEPIVDVQAALDGWHSLVRAQGWSPVGEPEVAGPDDAPVIIGRIVKYPGLTVDPDIRDAIVVPR